MGSPCFYFAFNQKDVDLALRQLRFPILVKHFDGYGSIGMEKTNRCQTESELRAAAEKMMTEHGGALLEEFIEGREFSVLVASDPSAPRGVRAFQPIEFVFPPNETFKHFTVKWKMAVADAFRPYTAQDSLASELKEAAATIFSAVGGSGYARIDYRVDAHNRVWAVDINPNCGLFYSPAYESSPGTADLILRYDPSGMGLRGFLHLLIQQAMDRQKKETSPEKLEEINRKLRAYAERPTTSCAADGAAAASWSSSSTSTSWWWKPVLAAAAVASMMMAVVASKVVKRK